MTRNEIRWNPEQDHHFNGSEDWHYRPPEVGLAGEAIHAWLNETNGKVYFAEGSNLYWMNNEFKAHGIFPSNEIPYTENAVRRDLGVKERLCYSKTCL